MHNKVLLHQHDILLTWLSDMVKSQNKKKLQSSQQSAVAEVVVCSGVGYDVVETACSLPAVIGVCSRQ